jgi:asparagine synthetase B (glutamine-hydrolysing)
MCGIFFSVSRDGPSVPGHVTRDDLHARGPDSYKELSFSITSEGSEYYLSFVSTVLALRGDHIQEQPLLDRVSGSVLCWNGEAWALDGVSFDGNDTVKVFELLLQDPQIDLASHRQSVPLVLQRISGPYAFVFYDAPRSTIYFGRDRLGRRSLLIDECTENSLTLCSVPTTTRPLAGASTEVTTSCIHAITFRNGSLRLDEVRWPEPLPTVNKILSPPVLASIPSRNSLSGLLSCLKQAISLRVVDIPTLSVNQTQPGRAKAAVLFSGGLDCTLIARLVHDVLPRSEPVDLLNVAFENPRSITAAALDPKSAYELCPDRITGRASFSELCKLCPARRWNFVAVNIPYSESQAHRPAIQRLMQPHNTEMDLSIAMALYFAARGIGQVYSQPEPSGLGGDQYEVPARVLLSGLGADELFGGYARHAAAYGRGGFEALAAELELDWTRIGSRNLGRDDRVMAHWGKEVRYPYLDEGFVEFSLGLPVWEKCGFRPGKGNPKHYEESTRPAKPEDLEPAKMLLRLALWDLGMPNAASERKRAIQFGAKTAKMDLGKGKTKGTDALTIPS